MTWGAMAATCSQVARSKDGSALSVNPGEWNSSSTNERDVILWCDHRGSKQAAQLNAQVSDALPSFEGEASDVEL